MWRLIPALRTVYAHHEEARWVDHFGVWETRTADVDTQRLLATGRESKRREYVSVRERPGISPHVIPLLVDKTAFLQLRDLGIALPPYQEEIHECPLNDTLASHYLQLKRAAPGLIQDARKTRDGHLLSSTIQALVAYPDRCWLEETLRTRDGELKFALPALPTTEMYPKEQALVNLVAHNRREQRRVLVFCTHTQTRDITHRLTMLLERAGYRASTLPASVRPERRMQWIQTRVEQGLEVLICNPRLVGTGLDLIDFPTVIWMEPEYSVYQVRQASRRSWRIGQTRPVTVTCLVYRETMQEHAWSLIASGIKASLQVEGDLTADGMCTYHQTDDILTQLIHSVLNANHQLPSAEKLFRELCALYALSSPGQASHTPRPPLNGSPCRALPPHVSTPSPEQAMTHPIQLTLFAA